MPVRSPKPVAVNTAVGEAPDRAADPHEEPFVTEMTLPPPEPQAEMEHTGAPKPRDLSPNSAVTISRAASFRIRTATFARVAVSAAHQRRALLGALLAVALVSASVGILAGQWLAARTATPAGVRR
jgi:hypothetical protein